MLQIQTEEWELGMFLTLPHGTWTWWCSWLFPAQFRGHLELLLLQTDAEFSSKGEALPMACQVSIQVNTGFFFSIFFFFKWHGVSFAFLIYDAIPRLSPLLDFGQILSIAVIPCWKWSVPGGWGSLGFARSLLFSESIPCFIPLLPLISCVYMYTCSVYLHLLSPFLF